MADGRHRLPALDLLVDGNRLPERCAQRFTALRVQQQLSLPAACELCFSGIDDADVQSVFRPGLPLAIAVRGTGAMLFKGRISAVESGYGGDRLHTLAVRAYDALAALRNRHEMRAFVGRHVADVARELTADLGLSVTCDEPGPAWPRVLQTGSDFDLLADLAGRRGLYFTLQDDCLCLQTLQGQGAVHTLTLNDDLHEVRFESNAHQASRRVSMCGWNPWRGSEHAAEAGAARSMHEPARQAHAAEIGGTDPHRLSGRAMQDDDQALALAQAELDARSAQALVLWGTAAGDPRLRPGARVRIKGVPPRLAGEHVLTRAVHTLDAQHGFVAEIASALPAHREPGGGTLMTLGIVCRIDDPDRLGRVQVALPAYGDIESDWLQVVAPGAGNGKGLVALPDVDDRVLVLLDRSDLAQAVVLGSLYAQAGLPKDHDGLGKQASFSFVTPGGHQLRLDDGARSMHLRASTGSWLEMAPDQVRLHAEAPMTIEAPGQKLTIRAKFIDFDRS